MAFSIQQVEHIEPMLIRYAMRAVRREDLADDLVQETWAAALASLPKFEGRSTLRTWMVGILRRKIVDHRRRQKDTLSFSDEYHGSRRDGTAPEQHIDSRDAVGELRRRLTYLPALERRAVELCDVADMARTQAADSLGITDGHLRVVLHRGRKRLREDLKRSGYALS